MKIGWYPDPDDDNARRYWDGEEWSAPFVEQQADSSPAPRPLWMCVWNGCGQEVLAPTEHCADHASPEEYGAWKQLLRRSTSRRPEEMIAASREMDKYRRPLTTAEQAERAAHVPIGDGAIVCPHCHQRGGVVTKRVKQKKGVSGGKATGALLTGGASLFATGLSRKETVTEFRCGKCVTTWFG